MNIEDFDNELSSDDSDFCPDKQEQSLSENSGPEDEPVDSDEARNETKPTSKRKKISKRRKDKVEDKKVKSVIAENEVDPEEVKRKEDAIWADFLSSTESPLDPEPSKPVARSTSTITSTSSKESIPAPSQQSPAPKEIFEFAGETIEVESSKSSAPEKSSTPATKLPTPGAKRATGGGLSSVLNQLSKKSKLSVLEKTKLDWDGFKSNEGINEELQTHNRGRDGFLERKDFLERTDHRQFQIEKNIRLTRRK